MKLVFSFWSMALPLWLAAAWTADRSVSPLAASEVVDPFKPRERLHDEQLQELIDLIVSENTQDANRAVIELHKLGEEAFHFLRRNFSRLEDFHGDLFHWPQAAGHNVPQFTPSVGMVCMYLVEAWHQNNLFFAYGPFVDMAPPQKSESYTYAAVNWDSFTRESANRWQEFVAREYGQWVDARAWRIEGRNKFPPIYMTNLIWFPKPWLDE